jgi:Asp-tRNA(Asn)/Glu-tRNA(Gln) amidotransferase A subunit family amidase
VKDIIDTFDMPTECGTPIRKGRRPTTDATIVSRLRAAGAIILGKTVTAELAFLTPGATRNPHDPARTPGGSSSGSAAAVAAGMVPIALATQTNGSVIRPAAFCGVVGYKPSLGVLPRTGILRQAAVLDQPGIISLDVADAAIPVEAMIGRDPEDEFSFDVARTDLLETALSARLAPKLAFVRGPFWDRADVEARQMLEAWVGTLGNLIDTVEMPKDFALAEDVLGTILCCGIAHSLHGDFVHGGKLMSDQLTRAIERGRGLSAADFLEACSVRDRLRKEYDVLATQYDAIVTLAAPGAAPLFTEGTGNPIFSTIWTLVGAPAITLPLWQNAEGMPIGVQLVGRLRGDAGLLSVAAWLERSCGGFAKRFGRVDVDA